MSSSTFQQFKIYIVNLTDLAHDDLIHRGYWRVSASVHDILNTCFWPFVIWFMVRFRVYQG